MSFEKGDKGFIFSLDATLAILVSLLALASVASMGTSLTTGGSFDRIRLQRTARDAVRTLSLRGAFENAVLEMEEADYNKAKEILRDNLNRALPEHIQFRLYIRNQLSVYPTESSGWDSLYDNIEDRTVSNYLFTVPAKENYFRVLAFTPESRENELVDNIGRMRPLWFIKKVSDVNNFRENVEKKDAEGNQFYDAVFIPDADIQFGADLITALKDFANKGRLVAAGDTLYNNQDTVHDYGYDFSETFGILDDDPDYGDSDAPSNNDIKRWDRNDFEVELSYDSFFWELKMYAQPVKHHNLDHPILYGFTPIDNLAYEGDNVYTYDDYYDPVSNFQTYGWFIPDGGNNDHDTGDDIDYNQTSAKVLTNWGDYPEDQDLDSCGLIVNDTSSTNGTGRAIFIGANVAQTVDRGASPYKWLRLTANSISGTSGYELFNNPITLSLWRGEGL